MNENQRMLAQLLALQNHVENPKPVSAKPAVVDAWDTEQWARSFLAGAGITREVR